MDIFRMQKELAHSVVIMLLLGTASFVVVQGAVGRTEFAQDVKQLAGNWTGESICQVKPSACRDEKVVYHISTGSDPNHVMVSADKIVDGKAINMGRGKYAYDRTNGTLVNENDGRVWRFTVKGNSMTGTLTMPDKTLYRRVTLRKEE